MSNIVLTRYLKRVIRGRRAVTYKITKDLKQLAANKEANKK